MKISNNIVQGRRNLLKTSALGILGMSMPNLALAHSKTFSGYHEYIPYGDVPKHFPNIDPEIISEVVGKSHSNLERVKELVDQRPELARSVWEWRFGDFESAIGAASHVGRRDIVQYLISKGARPTIFTFAMMGAHDTVKSMVEFFPGIQKTMGPHGISLLDHAYFGERMKDKMSAQEIDNLKKTVDYLESLGDAAGEKYLDVDPEEQKRYLGDYKYGDGANEGFSVQLNMRNLLSLAPIGGFGGSLYKLAENKFIYNGAPSVMVSFESEKDNIKSLKVSTPEVEVTALKI
ncbi:hypothetical protein [Flagellimonas meishanensis]|uniref:hypothetical protein n=1 Tax=Flagellimonas meishanensis TaxID=2873264 RepID=UPI001CA7784F|nr:hypothetical protein [[Muricauda] meishanensis]